MNYRKLLIRRKMFIDDTRSVSKSTLCNIDWSVARWIFEFENPIDPFREGNEKRRYLYAHACSIHDRRHRDVSCLSSIPNAFEKETRRRRGAQFCMLIRRGMRALESLDHTRTESNINRSSLRVNLFDSRLSQMYAFSSKL